MRFVIKREIDHAGRIVIPKEIRDYYGIEPYTELDIIPTEAGILITKVVDTKKVDISPRGTNNEA